MVRLLHEYKLGKDILGILEKDRSMIFLTRYLLVNMCVNSASKRNSGCQLTLEKIK